VVAPLSYDVKDMPLVQHVVRIFGLRNSVAQSDINNNRTIWTEKAALMDLKKYQTMLSFNSKGTLGSDDFDLEVAYQAWKKAETPDLSQMMLEIVQAKPELAKTSSAGSLPRASPQTQTSESLDAAYSTLSRKLSDHDENSSCYVIDQPVDMSGLNIEDDRDYRDSDSESFTFIPLDARAFYRFILLQAVTHDIQARAPGDAHILTNQSTELLSEIAIRWRIPGFTQMVLFLDVASQKFLDQEINLDLLDTAFTYFKKPPSEKRRQSMHLQNTSSSASLSDRTMWTTREFALNRQVLTNLNDALLRDVYNLMQHCYESKPPSVGPTMLVLEEHIWNDPMFSQSPEDMAQFTELLRAGLVKKAAEVYRGFLEGQIPESQEDWQFYHVIELGKVVMKLAEKIQKRYKRNPDIMGYVEKTFLHLENAH
jgi:hypothetical protein